MELVNYLLSIYGYGNPIFIKDVRIGRKSKTAIREEFYRAYKKGDLTRNAQGVYSIVKKDEDFPKIAGFEDIIFKKYIVEKNAPEGMEKLFVCGYYSGLAFVNAIGISQQVPAILEITTNRTSSKKRYYTINKRIAIIRKGKTQITSQNYEMLQFLDMFHFVTMNEVIRNKKILKEYIKKHNLTKLQFSEYIKFYGTQTIKKIVEGGIIDAFI